MLLLPLLLLNWNSTKMDLAVNEGSQIAADNYTFNIVKEDQAQDRINRQLVAEIFLVRQNNTLQGANHSRASWTLLSTDGAALGVFE